MRVDLITVLGKRPSPDGTPDWVMQSRLDTAVALFKQNPHSKIILQGGNSYDDIESRLTEAKVGYNYLQANYEMTLEDVILEEDSQTTLEQAIILKERFLLSGEVKSLALVTDEFHIKRAEIVFAGVIGDAAKITSVPAPVKIYGKYRELIAQHEAEDGLNNLRILVEKLPRGDHEAYKEYERKYKILRKQELAVGTPRTSIIPVEDVLNAKV